MISLDTKFVSDREIFYDGSQLASHWIYNNFDLPYDAVVSFVGGCNVRTHMVDLEDIKAGDFISSDKMLHFIAEIFSRDIVFASSFQMVLIGELYNELFKTLSDENKAYLTREGDDIFFRGKKLSISIATVSATSSLIHIAVNITNNGTPIETASLEDMNILDIESFAKRVLASFNEIYKKVLLSTAKVTSVGGSSER